MILLLHIVIALSSLVMTAVAFMTPKQSLLYAAYALIALTILSGTYVTVMSPGHMVQACVSGLLYTAIAIGATSAVRRKLAVDR